MKNSFEDQLAVESKYQIASAATKDFQEGLKAFIEKRKPDFQGK